MGRVEVKATSIAGLSAMYGISPATIERAIADGELPVSKLPGRRRVVIRIKDAEKWIGKSRPREVRSVRRASADESSEGTHNSRR